MSCLSQRLWQCGVPTFHVQVFICLCRFWRSLNPEKNEGTPPLGWSSPEWEVFKFLGAVGTDEPALRPFGIGIRGGSSGPPQRVDTKRRRQESCAGRQRTSSPSPTPRPDGAQGADTADGPQDVWGGSGQERLQTPTGSLTSDQCGGSGQGSGTESEMLKAMKALQKGVAEQTVLLRQFSSSDVARLATKRSMLRLEAVKAQLSVLPPGSPAYERALARLELLSATGEENE
mmetsp:Transcript_27301/g.77040  ORF Transcript_27301/g.77040 Transcript_27301/m.77040 type:complete len:231 (+) Transcript_27301:532-1224(+)